jgi:hypothetical protein
VPLFTLVRAGLVEIVEPKIMKTSAARARKST